MPVVSVFTGAQLLKLLVLKRTTIQPEAMYSAWWDTTIMSKNNVPGRIEGLYNVPLVIPFNLALSQACFFFFFFKYLNVLLIKQEDLASFRCSLFVCLF